MALRRFFEDPSQVVFVRPNLCTLLAFAPTYENSKMAVRKQNRSAAPKQVKSDTKIPHPLGTDLISRNTLYFRLAAVAELLCCTVDDLLHLGAIGAAEIIAPVISKRPYEWPVDGAGLAFPNIGKPFKVHFSAADKVILMIHDLAQIEAIGWTFPDQFRSPAKARELIELDELLDCEIGESERTTLPNDNVSSSNSSTLISFGLGSHESEFDPLREGSFYVPWRAVGKPSENEERVTIEHLFITKKEAIRLVTGSPQEVIAAHFKDEEKRDFPTAVSGGTERFASVRLAVLQAAVALRERFPSECEKSRDWASVIDREANRFWEDGEPPLSLDAIERLIGKARRLKPVE